MKTRIIVVSALATLVLASCASLSRKGSSSFSDSKSPYVKEETTPKPKPAAATNSTGTSSASTVKTAAPAREVVVREEKVRVVDNIDQAVYNYYVILGSFKILDNAKNFRSQLSNEGFRPVILENENGLYRISVASSNDEQPARNRIAEIRSNYAQYSDVWLLVRKK
ncbi:MAG: SPOR domain-containing protein [Breznakibacter sp.]